MLLFGLDKSQVKGGMLIGQRWLRLRERLPDHTSFLPEQKNHC